MAPRLKSASFPRLCRVAFQLSFITACFTLCLIPADAKEAPLTAIELFDGPNGAAYAQVTDVVINGKTEMRVCSSPERIDKSAYGKLPKVSLVGATSLER